jgi:hypothetical protein
MIHKFGRSGHGSNRLCPSSRRRSSTSAGHRRGSHATTACPKPADPILPSPEPPPPTAAAQATSRGTARPIRRSPAQPRLSVDEARAQNCGSRKKNPQFPIKIAPASLIISPTPTASAFRRRLSSPYASGSARIAPCFSLAPLPSIRLAVSTIAATSADHSHSGAEWISTSALKCPGRS